MLTLFDPKPCDVGVYQSDLQTICGQFDVASSGTASHIHGALNLRNSSGMDVALVAQNAELIRRDTQHIRRDPGDHFFLVIQHRGSACMSQDGKDAWLKPGDMFVADATRPSQFYYGGEYSEQISLHLPRVDMLHRYGKRISGGVSVSSDDALANAMQAILLKLLAPSDICQNHVLEAFYGVFGAILTERDLGSGRKLNPDRQIVTRALEAMSHHYANPDFTTAHLADLLGISLRQLQRAFLLIDETPHARLQRVRIESAHTALLKQGGAQATITSIAYDHGFSDLSTFYRHFKAHYGVAPKHLITE